MYTKRECICWPTNTRQTEENVNQTQSENAIDAGLCATQSSIHLRVIEIVGREYFGVYHVAIVAVYGGHQQYLSACGCHHATIAIVGRPLLQQNTFAANTILLQLGTVLDCGAVGNIRNYGAIAGIDARREFHFSRVHFWIDILLLSGECDTVGSVQCV